MAADLQARHASSHADENQWMDGAQGLFWGRYGAAGMLLQNQNDEILLQLRAAWCHHGGTWGIPGGALRNGESPEVGALREMGEEHGLPAERIDVFGTYTANFGYWSYVTVIGRLHAPWTPRLNSSEADSVRWTPMESVVDLPLHPGFRSAWPALRGMMLGLAGAEPGR